MGSSCEPAKPRETYVTTLSLRLVASSTRLLLATSSSPRKLRDEIGDKVELQAIAVVDGTKVVADPAEAGKIGCCHHR